MPAISAYITLDDKQVYDPARLVSELDRLERQGIYHGIDRSRFLNKCNSFTSPRGFSPGRGYVLMLGKDANALTTSGADHTLKFVAGGTITYSKLLIVDMAAVTGVEEYTDDALYVVELADLRVLGSLTSINKSYNVLTVDDSNHFAATLNGGSPWTYTEVVNDIWDLMPSAFGALGLVDANLPTQFDPKNYVFRGISAWAALERILTDIDHTLVLTRSGSFGVVDCADNPAGFDEDRSANEAYLLSGSNDLEATISYIPEKVRVFFPKLNKAFQGSSDTRVLTPKDLWQTDPLYSVDVTTSSIDANIETVAETIAPVHDSQVATYDADGAITNAANLSTRATDVATAYINSLLYADDSKTYRYSGARSFTVDANVASVSYHDFGDGIVTDVIARARHLPISPLLGKNGNRSAQTVRDALYGILENPNAPIDLLRYFPDSERIVVARADADIVTGASAAATVLRHSGSWGSASKTITVENIHPDTIAQDTVILAWYHQQSNKWLAIPFGTTPSSGNDRIFVAFQLTERMGATVASQASASVIDAIGTGAPSPLDSITVLDPQDRFLDCMSGGQGIAINWGTSGAPEYHVIDCTRVLRMFRATVTASICATDTGNVTASLGSFTFVGFEQGPFRENPTSDNVVVTNPAGHAAFFDGQAGDDVWCERVSNSLSGGKWQFQIYKVEKHEVTVPNEFRVNTDGQGIKTLQWRGVKAAIEYCDDQTDWVDIFTPTEESVVIGGSYDDTNHQYKLTRKKVWVFASDTQTDHVLHTLSEQDVVIENDINGFAFRYTPMTIYVAEKDTAKTPVTYHTGVDCA